MRKNKNSVERQLLSEAMDADTLEDKAETEELLIETEENDISAMVRNSYKNLSAGHAIIREKVFAISVIVLGFMFIGGLTVLILYGFVYWGMEGHFVGFIGIIPVAVSIVTGIFVFKRCYKIFDVYFFNYKGKRIIFYVNKKFSILYKNRTACTCINNFTGNEVKYTPDDFMNIKLGFNRFVGKMTAKKRKDGYLIKTKEFKRFTVSQFSGNSKLWIDKDLKPKKILLGEKDIYKFKLIDKDFAETSPEIAQLMTKFSNYL